MFYRFNSFTALIFNRFVYIESSKNVMKIDIAKQRETASEIKASKTMCCTDKCDFWSDVVYRRTGKRNIVDRKIVYVVVICVGGDFVNIDL